MGPTDRFSPDEVQRILGLTEKQLDYWERLRLVSPQKEQGIRSYDFRDLIGLRTVKQLVENGVPANRLRRALAALREKLAHAEAPLSELRVLSDGGTVIVERGGTRLEPLSGQFVLNFETRELNETVRVMTGRALQPGVRVRKTKGVYRSEATLAGVCEVGPHGSLGELCAPAMRFLQGHKVGWNIIRSNSSHNERNKAESPSSKKKCKGFS